MWAQGKTCGLRHGMWAEPVEALADALRQAQGSRERSGGTSREVRAYREAPGNVLAGS